MQFGFLTTAILFCSVLTTPATGGSNPKYFFKSLQIPKRDYCTNVNELCQSQKKFSEKFKSSDKRLKNLLHPQIQTLHLVLKELNDTKHAIFASFNFLKKLLSEDSKSIANVKERVQARIINLENEVAREQMLLTEISKAEKDFNTINKKEKQNDTSSAHSSKMQKYIEEVLSEVSDSADKLEDSLEENVYSSQKGGAYEVVLRVNENEEGDILDSRGNNYSQLLSDQTKYVMTSLIDSNSNRYVLSKANDPTLPHEDRHLIQSLFFIIILSFIFVLLCNILHMPTMFGFVIMGMILGPTGLNLIQSTVQIETLGEFGVFLIIFSLGLEFSPDKIKKVWKVAVFGSTAIMITVVLCGVVWGLFFGIPARQSLFVAACLCLSSTPLVAKFISSSSLEKTSLHTGDKLHTNGDDYASPLLGILVMQDVHMGFLIAILPALAGHHGTRSARVIKTGLVHNLLHGIRHSEEALPIGWLIFELILAVIGVMIFGYFITKYFLGKFFRFLQSREEGSSELTTLGLLSFCFIFLQLTDLLGISMELGCFIAGTMISSLGEENMKELNKLLEPIKDLFSCIFFTSIGLHVFPTFLFDQLTLIVVLTLGVVIIKLVVASSVLRFLTTESKNVRFIIAAGLAQVSEFSFVVGSRARRLGLITREIYLIILSVTSLSLFIAPLLWKMALWKFAGRRSHAPRIVMTLLSFLLNKILQYLPV